MENTLQVTQPWLRPVPESPGWPLRIPAPAGSALGAKFTKAGKTGEQKAAIDIRQSPEERSGEGGLTFRKQR